MVAQSRRHPSGHVRSTQVAYMSGVEAPTLLQSREISHSLARSRAPSRDPVGPREALRTRARPHIIVQRYPV